MLCIAPMGTGQSSYYTKLANISYYTEGGEPPGVWMGNGRGVLKLSGQVDPEHLRRLFDGFDPHTKRPLVQNAGVKTGKTARKPGWDFTFHVPKSVSILWAIGDERTRKEIQKSSRIAIQKALELLEQKAGWAVKGKKGWLHVPAKLVVSVFPHGTSRALDMDYHLHCLILNVGVCEDGKTRCLLSRPLYEWSPVVCRYFRVVLEEELRKRLGLNVYRPVDDKGQPKPLWDIQGIPEDIKTLFSKRRADIEKHLGKSGLESAAAATVVALETRPIKDIIPPRKELFQKWQKELLEAGHSLTWASKVIGHKHTLTNAQKVSEFQKALGAAVGRITSSRSHFTQRDLLQATLEESMGRGLQPEFIVTQVDHNLAHNEQFVNLGTRNAQQRFTTHAVLKVEKKLLDSVGKLHKAKHKPLSKGAVDKSIKQAEMDGKKVTLNEEQQKAVHHLTRSPGRIKTITGLAGTGKTTMLRVAREAFEKAGHEVHGCALAGVAAKKLQEGSGITCDTLAMTLKRLYPSHTQVAKHHAKQLVRTALKQPTRKASKLRLHSKSVVVLDESSMVGTRDFELLVRAVTQANAKLICLGDHRQLPSIEAGGAFGSILQRIGCVDLQEIRRQERIEDRDRVKRLSRGEAETVIKEIAKDGNLHVASDREQAEEKIVEDWANNGGAVSPGNHLMFVGTNHEVDRLNCLAQQKRLEMGEINERRQIKIGDHSIYQGDRIIITKKNRKLGLENGDQGELVAIRSGGFQKQVAIRLDGEQEVRIIPVRTMLDTEFEHIRLGYAHTTHRMQGATVDHAYCLLGGRMTDREMSYVQASRHRKKLSLYADENECGVALTNLARKATGEGQQIRNRSGISPEYSPLSRQMSQSRAQDLAHDVLESPSQNSNELIIEIER